MAHAHIDIWSCKPHVSAKVMGDGQLAITITAGSFHIVLSRGEVAALAADLLDAIGAKSCEVVDVDNALPPVLERAIRQGEGA